MNIYGKKTVLRAIEKEDCILIVDMFNDPEIESKVIGWSFPLSRYAQEKWLENHYNDTDYRFIIENDEKSSRNCHFNRY